MLRSSEESLGFEQISVPFGRTGPSFARPSILGSTGTSLSSSLVPSEENSNGCDMEVDGRRVVYNSRDAHADGSLSGPSHLRLRTALLNSGRAVSNPTFNSNTTPTDPHRNDSTLPPKPSDDSSISYTGETNQEILDSAPKLVQRMQSDPTYQTSPRIDTYQLLTRSLSRPPSASNILRRASCDDLIEPSQIKSISQPQSPDFRLRHTNTLPTSPCRLPMKKRKVDWDQLDNLNTSSTPLTTTECQTLKQSGKSTHSRQSATSTSNNQNHLVIDCPLSNSGGLLERKSLQDLASVGSMDRLPRSLSSHLTPREDFTRMSPHGSSSHSKVSSLLSPAACIRHVDSKESRSSKFSLLARTLTSVSDLSHPSIQHLHGSDPGVRTGEQQLRPHQLNASDPCIHPSSTPNYRGSGDHFLSKVISSHPVVSHPSASNGDRWLPITSAPASKPSSNSFSQPVTILLKNNEANKFGQLSVKMTETPRLGAHLEEQMVPRPAISSPVILGNTASSDDTSTDGRRHPVTNVWDNAQVLMMLSPTNKESPKLYSPTDASTLKDTLHSTVPTSPLFKLDTSSSNFPLLLISASSSAGAEALAAAAARATGAPPSSLVPVPVQLTAYVPNGSPSRSSPPGDHTHVGPDASHGPRFMISLCTQAVDTQGQSGSSNHEQNDVSDGGQSSKNPPASTAFHSPVPNNSISMSYTAAAALAQSNI